MQERKRPQFAMALVELRPELAFGNREQVIAFYESRGSSLAVSLP